MALIATKSLDTVIRRTAQHGQQQQRCAEVTPQTGAVRNTMQVDMLRAVGVGVKIGDDAFCLERRVH